MKEWNIYKIADIVDEISMGPFGSNIKVENFISEGIPVLNGSNLQGYKLNEESFNYVSEEKANSLGKANAYRGDVVITHRGTLGQIIYIPSDSKFERYVISQSQFRLKLKRDIVRPDFLVYYFHTAIGQHKILMNASQVGVPALARPTSTFREVTLPIPPMDIQNKIMDILLSIDGKLAVNKQINDNLEQQAQAAFNNIIAHYSECETINLSEIAVLNPKRTISKGTLARSIEMAQLPTSGSFPAGWDMKEYNGGMKFQNGDTLMARITPCLENGKVAYINFLEENEVAFGSTEYIVIASKGAIAPEVFYFLTRHNDFIDFAVKNMNGSSGRQRVSAETIGTYKLPVISPEDIVVLETIAKEALNKIKYNSLENIRLSEMRDTLLPKLMSGELKINEIDC